MLACPGKYFVLLGEFLEVAILFLFFWAFLCMDMGAGIAEVISLSAEDEATYGREQSQENHRDTELEPSQL